AAGSPIPTGTGPTEIAVGDFNLDGTPDVAVTNQVDGTVSVMLSNGDGTFIPAPGSPFPVPSPFGIAVGTFGPHGTPDLVIAGTDPDGSGLVAPLLNKTDPPFLAESAAALFATVGTPANGVAVATFTNPDLSDAATEYSATINWGDGHTSDGSITANGPGRFQV